jgi:hypothetical protein
MRAFINGPYVFSPSPSAWANHHHEDFPDVTISPDSNFGYREVKIIGLAHNQGQFLKPQ